MTTNRPLSDAAEADLARLRLIEPGATVYGDIWGSAGVAVDQAYGSVYPRSWFPPRRVVYVDPALYPALAEALRCVVPSDVDA